MASGLGGDEDDTFFRLPHLYDRELGGPNVNEDGAPVVWDYPLPFLGHAVTDLAFELPLTFGISVIPATFEQDLTLRDLSLALQGEAISPIDAVDLRNPSVRNSALQVMFDAWLFPFMHIFATLGRVDGRAAIPLSVWGVSCYLSSAQTHCGTSTMCY